MPNPSSSQDEIDTSRPTAIFQPQGPRPWTLSIALPSSIISNSKKKLDLRTYLVGTLSRALAIFNVDEIVTFDDFDHGHATDQILSEAAPHPESTKLTAFTHPAHFLAYLLSYQETPPFMRTRLFPMHENLAKAGTLPSLDLPHHLRANEWCEFREGITVGSSAQGTFVDCGLPEQRLLRGVQVPVKTRVTVRVEEGSRDVEAVAPDAPRTEGGYYWGYAVRVAAGLSEVFTECPFDGGYTWSVGTSERGTALGDVLDDMKQRDQGHALIVFGGVSGLEVAAQNDVNLQKLGVGKGNVSEIFDYWVNLAPGQGSRTIRTEEAVWMGLMGLRAIFEGRGG